MSGGRELDHTKGGAPGGAAAGSAWTSGFEPLRKGATWANDANTEDAWEFEEDTYSLGLVAVTKRGLPSAAVPLMFALATPLIQLVAFFKIYEHMISEPHPDDPMHVGCSLYVRLICFVLMALSLSNEGLEGLSKVVFCLRAIGGVYEDIKGIPIIGLVLSFFQFGMTIGTIGLSMLVVSEQTTALDAFMNFVALAFLTEIDNIFMSARTVQNFVSAENTFEGKIAPNALQAGEKGPWTVPMMIACNLLLMVAWTVTLYIYYITAEWSPDRESFSLAGHLPSVIITWLALMLCMWFGSKQVGAMAVARTLFFICVLMDSIDKVYLYNAGLRFFSPFLMSVTFWFEFAGPVTAMAVVQDPMEVLRCPVKSPLLVWTMLIQAVFMFDSLYRFGVQ